MLPTLFHTILVARTVADQVARGPFGAWLAQESGTTAYQIEDVSDADRLRVRFSMHEGERDTLALALREGVPVIYGDDRSLLASAPREGIRVVTFADALGAADAEGLVSADEVITGLRRWLSPERERLFRQRAGLR